MGSFVIESVLLTEGGTPKHFGVSSSIIIWRPQLSRCGGGGGGRQVIYTTGEAFKPSAYLTTSTIKHFRVCRIRTTLGTLVFSFRGPLHDAAHNAHYTAIYGRVIQKWWNGMYLEHSRRDPNEVSPYHLPGGTKENHWNLSRYPTNNPKLEPSFFRTQVETVIATTATS